MSEADTEIEAIGKIAGILEALNEDQKGRVIRYLAERFNITCAPERE